MAEQPPEARPAARARIVRLDPPAAVAESDPAAAARDDPPELQVARLLLEGSGTPPDAAAAAPGCGFVFAVVEVPGTLSPDECAALIALTTKREADGGPDSERESYSDYSLSSAATFTGVRPAAAGRPAASLAAEAHVQMHRNAPASPPAPTLPPAVPPNHADAPSIWLDEQLGAPAEHGEAARAVLHRLTESIGALLGRSVSAQDMLPPQINRRALHPGGRAYHACGASMTARSQLRSRCHTCTHGR